MSLPRSQESLSLRRTPEPASQAKTKLVGLAGASK